MDKFKKINFCNDLIDLIPRYVSNTFRDLVVLEENYENSNFDSMKKICHRILGTAHTYGFEELDEVLRKLYVSLREDKMDSIVEDFFVVKKYIKFLKVELKDFM